MANEEQLAIIRQGGRAWNEWRAENLGVRVDLSNADLSNLDLREANLRWANLVGADLQGANLIEASLDEALISNANLRGANLFRADLRDAKLTGVNLNNAHFPEANLFRAKLCRANLSQAMLSMANLLWADLSEAVLNESDLTAAILSGAALYGADLKGSNLSEVNLVDANLENANITGSRVYGISAWGVNLKNTKQDGLIITQPYESAITVDNLEVAQFIYLLLNNEKIRQVIDTITSKVVLILGRFTLERKAVLDAIKEELRKRDYLPILFDFDKPASRDLTETISTLAHMARFIIADITDAKAVPVELERIVPQLPSVAIQPIVLCSDSKYSLFEHIERYPWVLRTYQYENQEELLASIEEKIIVPAEEKVVELMQ